MDKNTGRTRGSHIFQHPPEYSFCAGCASCEIVCALTHDGVNGPGYNRIFMRRDIRTMVHTIESCRHCSDHPCFDACPKRGKAMIVDERGVVCIVDDECIGCGACVRVCVYDPPRINLVKSDDKRERKAKKCDMCRGRDEGPVCVEWCPVRCLGIREADE